MGATRSTSEPGTRGLYFFLSYPRSFLIHPHSPIPDREESAPDIWVTKFFLHLSAEVSRLARPRSGFEPGYLADGEAAAEDEPGRVAAALGLAEVFVPMYCDDYLRRSWPLREWAAFRRRMATHPADRIRGHEQPVLWVPLTAGNGTPELDQALELGADIPAYAENGLRSMSQLTCFRDEYATILRRLARSIVAAAEGTPMGRSAVPVPVRSARPKPARPSFVIGVIAPTEHTLPAGHLSTGYGPTATAWRPYTLPDPVAEYAAEYAAHQLGVYCDTEDVLHSVDALTATAGIVLIDPWIVAIPDGRNRLRTTITALPEWVVPFVLTNDHDPGHSRRGESLLAEVRRLLAERHHEVTCARTVTRFIELTPRVLNQAKLRYLSLAPIAARPPSGSRPSLRD